MPNHRVYLVEGVRTPFLRAATDFKELTSYDLARHAMTGLLTRTALDPAMVDRVILGTVISNVATSNVAREAALGAGLPVATPAHTVTQACISANQAITSGSDLIRLGQADIIIAGGTESMSDIPIKFRKPLRQRLIEAQRYKSLVDYLGFLKGLRPADFLPEVPPIAEFSTGLTMGADCERLASRFEVTRQQQDAFAARSHQLAARAAREGLLAEEIVPVAVPPAFQTVQADNGIRPDTTVDKLAGLGPAFSRPYGTLTAGNSSFLSDGAAVVLLASGSALDRTGLTPRAEIVDYAFSAQSPIDSLLLGPACATPPLLDRCGIGLEAISVFEFHEAFAGQVLANLNCLASPEFARDALGMAEPAGQVPMDKLNRTGGSLSLGHPFGATGARLATTAANRLKREGGDYALVAACAAGGMGNAILLRRPTG